MDYRIRWSPKGGDSFEEICEYIAKDSPHYARLFAREINQQIKNLEKFPNIGQPVPECANKNYLQIPYKSYRIIYRVKDNMIEIGLIIHGARILPELE